MKIREVPDRTLCTIYTLFTLAVVVLGTAALEALGF